MKEEKNRENLILDVEESEESSSWIHWMGHELKTPLSRLESLVANLERLSSYDFEQRKILDRMKESIEECKNSMDAVFIFERIKRNSISPTFQLKDMNRILTASVQKNELWAQQKGISLIVETEPLFPLPVDENLIMQSLSNILENAIKYSPSESRVLISSEEMGSDVIVQIADQGCGMSVDDTTKIFSPYYRTEFTQEIAGTGLGLAIAKAFIDFHGGLIEVDSVLGTGSTFTIKLPKEGAS